MQLEQLERRNNLQRKHPHVKDRVKATDVCIQKCRQLIGVDDAAAALLYVKCMSLVEETDRIIVGGRSSAMSSVNSHASTMKVQPIEMVSKTSLTFTLIFQQTFTQPAQQKPASQWTTTFLNADPVQIQEERTPEDQYIYNYYGYYKNKWWRILCMNSSKEAKEKDNGVRDLWNTQIEFFLSCLGFIVGVGNIIQFPVMIHQYGGVFFVPYIICLAVLGLPLVYMHLCIGQYSGLSASGAFWKIAPISAGNLFEQPNINLLLLGIGWALVLLAVPVSIYYNVSRHLLMVILFSDHCRVVVVLPVVFGARRIRE
jgi:hypothetical protein